MLSFLLEERGVQSSLTIVQIFARAGIFRTGKVRTISALALGLCGAFPAWAKFTETPAYQLKQSCSEIGELTIVVGENGLRATNTGRGYFIVSRPPKWEVIIVRPREKAYAVMPLETWCSSTLLVMVAANSWDADWSNRPAF